MTDSIWIALSIGNSRLHWAWFENEALLKVEDKAHRSSNERELFPFGLSEESFSRLPKYIASVVPAQTAIWQSYGRVKIISLTDVPLHGIYPTMGIDRALALLGAIEMWGCPCLVIDGGTALTFTSARGDRECVGGAILPGLRLQLRSLARKTAALPEIKIAETLPPRWANQTPEAIASGVIYSALAGIKDFIEDWWSQFPESRVILTGGDGNLLLNYLQVRFPHIAIKISIDPNLIFWGMRSCLLNPCPERVKLNEGDEGKGTHESLSNF